MKLLRPFALGLLLGLVCLPLAALAAASLREKVGQAWREFRAGWYGRDGYEARGGGGAPAGRDDSELVMTIPTASELFITVRPLP